MPLDRLRLPSLGQDYGRIINPVNTLNWHPPLAFLFVVVSPVSPKMSAQDGHDRIDSQATLNPQELSTFIGTANIESPYIPLTETGRRRTLVLCFDGTGDQWVFQCHLMTLRLITACKDLIQMYGIKLYGNSWPLLTRLRIPILCNSSAC